MALGLSMREGAALTRCGVLQAISDVAVRSRVYSFGFAHGVATVWNGMTNLTNRPTDRIVLQGDAFRDGLQ
jgi:hypothetical protein